MSHDKTFYLYTDGGSRNNPGQAAIGVVIKNDKQKIISKFGQYLGIQTNNYAEYTALIEGLKKALELNINNIQCFVDSALVFNQINGNWKIKHPELQKLAQKIILNLKPKFKKFSLKHIPRNQNKEADKLVNEVLDNLSNIN